jgi:hypothetical protein
MLPSCLMAAARMVVASRRRRRARMRAAGRHTDDMRADLGATAVARHRGEVSPAGRQRTFGAAHDDSSRPACSRMTTADGRSPGLSLAYGSSHSVAFPGASCPVA